MRQNPELEIVMKHLIVDGMLGGTGVRDVENGGYVSLLELNISAKLRKDIEIWLEDYANAHFFQFEDKEEITKLDKCGINLAIRLQKELTNSNVEYFSNAFMKKVQLDGRPY